MFRIACPARPSGSQCFSTAARVHAESVVTTRSSRFPVPRTRLNGPLTTNRSSIAIRRESVLNSNSIHPFKSVSPLRKIAFSMEASTGQTGTDARQSEHFIWIDKEHCDRSIMPLIHCQHRDQTRTLHPPDWIGLLTADLQKWRAQSA